jgi:hypothetical protein
MVITGVGTVYLLQALLEFGKGFKKMVDGLKDIGQDFETKIQKLDRRTFINLCTTLKQEKIIVLKQFLETHGDWIASNLDAASFTSLGQLPTDTIATIASLIQHPLVYSHPNVCDPDVQTQWQALTRVSSHDSFVHCQTMTFETYEDYDTFRNVSWAKGSMASASVLFQEVIDENAPGMLPPFTFTEYYGANANHVPKRLIRDPQGKESEMAQTTFEFMHGQFEVCTSAKNIWRSLGDTVSPFPIPDYIQTDASFPDKNKFLVAVVQPYIGIKPFSNAKDLARFSSQAQTPWGGVNEVIDTYQEYRDTINHIAGTIDRLLGQAQMITTYAQVSVEGNDGQLSLTGMHFYPKLMDTTLQTWMDQTLRAEFE